MLNSRGCTHTLQMTEMMKMHLFFNVLGCLTPPPLAGFSTRQVLERDLVYWSTLTAFALWPVRSKTMSYVCKSHVSSLFYSVASTKKRNVYVNIVYLVNYPNECSPNGGGGFSPVTMQASVYTRPPSIVGLGPLASLEIKSDLMVDQPWFDSDTYIYCSFDLKFL